MHVQKKKQIDNNNNYNYNNYNYNTKIQKNYDKNALMTPNCVKVGTLFYSV